MNSGISEEAKRAIANGTRRRAADRLDRDGCHSMDAVRRRVRASAQSFCRVRRACRTWGNFASKGDQPKRSRLVRAHRALPGPAPRVTAGYRFSTSVI
jgi:hypothetical protein